MSGETKKFWEYFILAIAALSSVVTLFGFVFQSNIQFESISMACKIVSFIAIILICLVYACIMTESKDKVIFRFNPQFNLTIEKGNLFEKQGIIVIPVNEYFDTHVGDGIISPNTIHGKFITNYFRNRVNELDKLLDNALRGKKYHTNESRRLGKKFKYDLGTCVDITIDDNVYVLVALTHFDGNDHAYLDKKDYPIVFDRLISHLHEINMHVEKPIYMPIMGSGLSRLRRSPQRILNFLVDAIDFKYSAYTFPYGLNIEIFDINQVNLNQLETHFDNDLSL